MVVSSAWNCGRQRFEGWSLEPAVRNGIVILTTGTTEISWLDIRKECGGMRLSLEKSPEKVLFTTIHKFKGLEAEAILIVDASTHAL